MKKNLKLYISYLSHTFDFVSVEQFIHEITRKYFNNQTNSSDRSINYSKYYYDLNQYAKINS